MGGEACEASVSGMSSKEKLLKDELMISKSATLLKTAKYLYKQWHWMTTSMQSTLTDVEHLKV